MTTTPPKTHAEVAKKLWKRLLDADVDACNPDCDDQTRGPVAILAAAIRDAEERGRIAQIALDLPASLESEERGNRLEAMIERMIENNVNQGVVLLGGENGITRVAAPVGSILDDAGNVRRDRLNEMREVRGWLSSAVDRMELADVTRLPWLAAALTNSYQQLDAFIGEREAALHAKDAQGAKHE